MDAAFRSAQSRWDHMVPMDRDDEPTQYELALATDEWLTDTWSTSYWLSYNLQQPEGQVTRYPLGVAQEDISDLTLDQLWVLMLNGTDQQLIAARFELRERMVKACAADIEARVPVIRAGLLADAAELAGELDAEAA